MVIRDFLNRHKGQRCWILGNGPSLNDIDLGSLRAEITFGTNRLYLKGFIPTYYCAVNPLVLEQFYADIAGLPTVKFLPQKFADIADGDTIPLDTSLRFPAFSSPEGPIWEGYTVTYVCLQLAYYMGFEEVYLIGCDHDYGPVQGAPNQEVTGSDHGHFSPDYFKGVKWNLPDLRMSEFAYSLAQQFYTAHGRRVVNASARTKLAAFPLLPFNHVICPDPPKVSAIVSAYKAADCIDGLIEDLKTQTLIQSGDAEIVAACQENSYEHAALLAAKEHGMPVTIVITPDIPTIYAAWNLCVRAAHGEFLTNANTDDRHHPKAFELIAQVLDGRDDLDLVYHDSYITWEDGQTFAGFLQASQGKEVVVGRVPGKLGVFAWTDYDKALLKQGCFIGPQPMWRANLHQKYGLFNPTYFSAGDYDFWLRCAGERNYYHLPMQLGLYHASQHGIEMSDPERAAREALDAQRDNQAAAIGINFANEKQVKIFLGGEFLLAELDEFLDAYEWIRYGGDPKVEW